jgi:hypothetical protein
MVNIEELEFLPLDAARFYLACVPALREEYEGEEEEREKEGEEREEKEDEDDEEEEEREEVSKLTRINSIPVPVTRCQLDASPFERAQEYHQNTLQLEVCNANLRCSQPVFA